MLMKMHDLACSEPKRGRQALWPTGVRASGGPGSGGAEEVAA